MPQRRLQVVRHRTGEMVESRVLALQFGALPGDALLLQFQLGDIAADSDIFDQLTAFVQRDIRPEQPEIGPIGQFPVLFACGQRLVYRKGF